MLLLRSESGGNSSSNWEWEREITIQLGIPRIILQIETKINNNNVNNHLTNHFQKVQPKWIELCYYFAKIKWWLLKKDSLDKNNPHFPSDDQQWSHLGQQGLLIPSGMVGHFGGFIDLGQALEQ